MKFIARCIDSIERRPFIFASLFLFFLIFSCFEQFLYSFYKATLAGSITNFFGFIFNTGAKSSTNIENAIEGTAQAATAGSLGSTLLTLLITVLLLFAFSVVVSVYFSGYFHILNISLNPGKEKTAGEFKKGLIKHYFKITLYIFFTVMILLLAVVGAAFVLFPALLSFNMVYGGNNGLLLTSIFLILITVVVLAFIISIILMYTLYMYPALINFKKGAGYMSRKIVNTKFWYILPRLIGFVIVLAAWQWFLIHIGYGLDTFAGSIGAFVLNAIVKTYMIFSTMFFVFFTFKQIKNAIQSAEDNEDEDIKMPQKAVSNAAPRTMQRMTSTPPRQQRMMSSQQRMGGTTTYRNR